LTDKRRREIATEYRKELDRRAKKGEPRKSWVPAWLQERNISRRSLYDYCKKYGVKTG
jgi:hypothetical protein